LAENSVRRGSEPMPETIKPDLILHGGKIVTVDPGFSLRQAVAVYNGRIVAVGADSDIDDLAGPRTRMVDLRGRCVVPGQYDDHVHFLLAGMDALGSKAKVDIARLPSIEDILTAIHERTKVSRRATTWTRFRRTTPSTFSSRVRTSSPTVMPCA
jgi:predicted amidohydrolase YtcJ